VNHVLDEQRSRRRAARSSTDGCGWTDPTSGGPA
jgi:hypothetical protein